MSDPNKTDKVPLGERDTGLLENAIEADVSDKTQETPVEPRDLTAPSALAPAPAPPSPARPASPPRSLLPSWMTPYPLFLASGVAALVALLSLGWPAQRALLGLDGPRDVSTPVPGAGSQVRFSMLVQSVPDGALLHIDGTELGRTPYMTNSFECVVGTPYTLQLTLEGHHPWRREVTCLIREMARHDATLRKR